MHNIPSRRALRAGAPAVCGDGGGQHSRTVTPSFYPWRQGLRPAPNTVSRLQIGSPGLARPFCNAPPRACGGSGFVFLAGGSTARTQRGRPSGTLSDADKLSNT
jgi:hypothetical protein